MAKRRDPNRSQISVGVDDDLREQLEAAAKRAVRSLSGEVIFRLQQSLGENGDL
jgi:hypothetical protein